MTTRNLRHLPADTVRAAKSGFFIRDIDDRWSRPHPVIAWRITARGAVSPVTPFALPHRWALQLRHGYFYDQAGRAFNTLDELVEAQDTNPMGVHSADQPARATQAVCDDGAEAGTVATASPSKRSRRRLDPWEGFARVRDRGGNVIDKSRAH